MVSSKPSAFIQSFFQLMDTILEIRCQFFSGFTIPSSESSFVRLVETHFFYQILILTSGNVFSLLCCFFKSKFCASSWRLRKMEKKKMVSSSRKISCSLARIPSSFEYCLPLIPVIISTSRKKALIKKECLN